NQPATHRRGVLKWVFLALLAFGVGLMLLDLPHRMSRSTATPQSAPAETNSLVAATWPETRPWIRFTFTSVELREAAGTRWLAIDYLDDVHGDGQKSFPWETTIPGHKAETRATEFFREGKDSSPAVRHQRIEYRMPDSVPRDQLEKLRDDVAQALNQKAFRLGSDEKRLLFEFAPAEGGSFKAWIKVLRPRRILRS